MRDTKYHIYTSIGVNMSDLPSSLWKAKYATLHTIILSGAPKLQNMNPKLGNLQSLTCLSMRACQISSICEAIEHLGGTLTKLDLGENRIEVVPEFVGSKLMSLQTLSLDKNRIMVLPKSLNSLSNLMNLDLSGNSVSALDAGLAQCSNLVSVSLASNHFTDIPSFLDKLKSLQSLDISSNRIDRVVRTGVWMLPKLAQLNLSSNLIGDIPAEVCLAQQLNSLQWENNRCRKVHEGLFTLTKLVHLKLARNQIAELSERVSRLSSLQDLDLSSNQFDIIPHQLFTLPLLNESNLIIDDNPFRSIPIEIREASATSHNGHSTSLTSSASSSSSHSSGSAHRVGSASLDHQNAAAGSSALSRSHAIFRFLAQLSEKAPWRRMKLMLVGNGNIGKTSLKRALSASSGSDSTTTSSTPIRAVSKMKDKAKDAFKKAATNIGTTIGASFSSTSPAVAGSAEVFDPTADTIATDGIDIDDWIVDLEEYPDCIPAPKRPHTSSSSSSDTTSSSSSYGPSPAMVRTPSSSNISSSSSSSLSSSDHSSNLNIAVFSCYDFAGQDVYYPTHSLFVTSRSIYLVMFSLKDLEGSRVEYWLQMVQAKAGYSSPVIIVATHDDDRSLSRTFITDTLAAMKKKYSRFAFVKGVVSVSSKVGTGIKELRKLIVSLALSHQTMKEQVPRSYILLEGEIKKRRRQTDLIDDSSAATSGNASSTTSSSSSTVDTSSANASLDRILDASRSPTAAHDQHTVTLDEWFQMCEKCFLKTKEDAMDALNFLADVGVVFHFKSDASSDLSPVSLALLPGSNASKSNASTASSTSNPTNSASSAASLDNIVILNPQWIADLLSTVISLKHNYIRDGILDESVLPQLWKSYPASLHTSLVLLLKRFEIVLPMAQAGKYIVPSMLPKDNSALVQTTQTSAGGVGGSGGVGIGASPSSPSLSHSSSFSLPHSSPASSSEAPFVSLQNLWKPAENWYGPMARIVSIKFCPMGFFGRFVARAIHLPSVRTLSYSMNSFVAEMERTGERVVVLYNEWTYEVLVWSAAPNSPLPASLRKILFLICDTLEILHESLYSSNRRNVWVVCPHCMAIGAQTPGLFTTETCLMAFTYGLPTLPCTSHLAGSSSSSNRNRPSMLQKINSALFSRGDHHHHHTGSNPQLSLAPPTTNSNKSPGKRSPMMIGNRAVSPTPLVPSEEDELYVYSSSSELHAKLFSDFLTRKEKLRAKNIPLFGAVDEETSGEDSSSSHHEDSSSSSNNASMTNSSSSSSSDSISNPSAATKVEVPLERIAPDISFHSLGDLLIPFADICLGTLVARGGFAEIFKAEYKGETVAVKKFLSGGGDLSGDSSSSGDGVGIGAAPNQQQHSQISEEFSESFRELQHEAFLMAQLKHPNVVCLKALCVRPICMVMEWVPHGTLSSRLWDSGAQCLPWETRLKYALDVANGLAYLHSLNIMHLDFRSPNLLVFDPSPNAITSIKVADFGLSTSSSGSHKGIKAFNPFWSSPEILSRGTYDLSTDVYSLGIVLWELLQHGRPFEEHRSKYPGPEIILTAAIASATENLRPTFPANTPTEIQTLITQCWQHDATQRPTASDVVRQLEIIQIEYLKDPDAWPEPTFNPPPPETPTK